MSFTATINGVGNFTASVEGVGVFNVTAQQPAVFNVGMATVGIKGDKGDNGETGIITADAPLIYDSVLKNLSIDLSDYATLAYSNATFYPLTNPAGYITSAALNGYATEAWVGSQGYITSAALAPYLLSSTAAATYQPIGDYATNTALTNGLALKLDKPAVAGLADQVLSTDGVNNIWIDNFARALSCTVRNETGAPLTKGTVVYISGAAGNKPLVQKAIASSEMGSSKTFGILSQDIPNNQNGEAVAVGQLTKVDTFGLAEGVALWLSPTTAGTWTTTKPTAPNHAVFLGNVVRAHQTQGVIEVRIQNGYELYELHDVSVLDRANNDILWYDGTTSLWKSNTIAEVLGYTPANNADLANYYLASNPAGYITSSALSGYATESWVQSQGYLTAPYNPFDQTLNTTDSPLFASAKAGQFEAQTLVGGSTGVDMPKFIADINGILLGSGSGITFPDATTQTTAGISAGDAAATYYPLTNPSGFITSSALSGYATEAWVGSQGYLTAPYNPFDQTLNTADTVNFNRVEIKGSGMAVAQLYEMSNPTNLAIEAIGGLGGITNVQPYVKVKDFTSGNYLTVKGAGITFSDGTTQSTAATSPDLTPYARKAVTNTFTASQVIEVTDNTNAALRITQLGTGEAFRVEDSANPDATPFVINANGQVSIGGASYASNNLSVSGNTFISSGTLTVLNSGSPSCLILSQTNTGATNSAASISYAGTGDAVRITNTGTGNSFVVEDSTNPDSTPFVIDASGNVGVGYSTINYKLSVNGTGYFNSTLTSLTGVNVTNGASLFSVLAGGTAVPITITNLGTGNSFVVNDQSSDTSPFVIDASGNVGVKTATPAYDLDVNGTANVTTLRFADATTQTTAASVPAGTVVVDQSIVSYVTDALSQSSAPSMTNPFATEGYVDSAVNAYAASVTPLLPTANEKDALSAAELPSASNGIVTSSAMATYVAGEIAAIPNASTTVFGTVELATMPDATQAASSSLAITPATLAEVMGHSNFTRLYNTTWTTAVLGTGGVNSTLYNGNGRQIQGTTSAGAGYVVALCGGTMPLGYTASSNIDWTKRTIINARLQRDILTNPSNDSIFRITYGEAGAAPSYTNDPTVRSIGIKIVGSGPIQILAHDGTSLTTFTTTYTPVNAVSFDIRLVSDAAGNVQLFVNSVLVGSTTGGPTTFQTGTNSRNTFQIKCENLSTFTSAPNRYIVMSPNIITCA